jgi:uncharacterized protein involved in exopolysaccharide biosynthesis
MRGDQIWREQRRSKLSEESNDGGDAERGASATATIARRAGGAAIATASAARERSARWLLGATSTLGAQVGVAQDCAGFDCAGLGAVGAGQSGVQQSIANAPVAAAALDAAKHPTPPTDPAKMSASSTAANLRIVLKAYPPPGGTATPSRPRFALFSGGAGL